MAPPRRTNEVDTRSKNKSSKTSLQLSEVKCPICLDILIKPVTTPCNHQICLECFNRNIESVQIACPVCRRRMSVWVRQATRENKLVDREKWNQIKKSFPEHVHRKMSGEEESLLDDDDAPAIHNKFAQPGEIRKEYEALITQFQQEFERERWEEALASERLIRELQQQDQQQMVEETLTRKNGTTHHQHLLAKDIARRYIKPVRTRSRASSSQITSESITQEIVYSVSSIMKGALTSELLASLDKENTQLRSTSAESHDSISSEMCHFKPISAAPRTPPKRLPDGRFEEPEVVHTKPRRLDCSEYQSSKVLSIKIQAIMVDSQNKTECCSIPIHTSGTPFTNKKASGARKANIDLSFKENYPYFSGSGSQSLSPTKSVLTGANQNGAVSARAIKHIRASKIIHKTECNGDENLATRKRKMDDKNGQRKMSKVECDETDASTSASQPQSTNLEECEESWVELQREALERINQEERDRQLALQLQEEFNRSLQRGQQGNGYQYFLRSQKKK